MTKLNFFIIGAPKCGTTTLFTYLGNHPNIYFSRIKGPHYYADDMPGWKNIRDRETYYNLFKNLKHHHSIAGEASVLYLYSKTALPAIKKYHPDAKLLVILRNPIELTQSWHGQMVWTCEEEIEDFEIAWRLEKKRKRGLAIPKNCREPKVLFYSEIGMIGSQVERLINIFPVNQIKFILFDDLIKDTILSYKSILKFLEIDYDNRMYIDKINPYKVIRWKKLHGLIVKPSPIIVSFLDSFKNVLGLKKLNIIPKILKHNAKEIAPPKLHQYFQKEIKNFYINDIKLLSRILNRDLTYWLQ